MHSFPSVTLPTEFDYVPVHGFHAKPSMSWPPPNTDELNVLNWPVSKDAEPDFEVEIDGQKIVLKDQFQMYAPNLHLQCPLVSGILAPSLGGLCPLQVIVGGGEVLRDEQIYLAHKAADPERYPPSEEILERNGNTMKDVGKYPPTDVQLLVFEDGPHAATTIGHTRTARYEYRAVAQFASWALSKAQNGEVDVQQSASNSSNGTNASKLVRSTSKNLPHRISADILGVLGSVPNRETRRSDFLIRRSYDSTAS
jgi:acetyl esterase/lipase